MSAADNASPVSATDFSIDLIRSGGSLDHVDIETVALHAWIAIDDLAVGEVENITATYNLICTTKSKDHA